MITGITISKVEGRIDSVETLSKQRFPRLNINIDDVSGNNEKVNVNYTFVADYFDGTGKDAKSVGQIKLGGTIEVSDSKEATSAVMKKWNDNRSLPVELAEEIINDLNFRCSATGTLVAYSLGLIPPLMISTTKITEKKAEKG